MDWTPNETHRVALGPQGLIRRSGDASPDVLTESQRETVGSKSALLALVPSLKAAAAYSVLQGPSFPCEWGLATSAAPTAIPHLPAGPVSR